MTNTITLVDTSVLCELLQVLGKSNPDRGADVRAEVDRRWRGGERFVIPITAVIETGNHIAQADGNRYDVAGRLVRLLQVAISEESHWRVLERRLGPEFLTSLCTGDSTGQSLEALAAARVGAGDIAILVEREQMRPPDDPFHERLVAACPQIRRFLPLLIDAVAMESTAPAKPVLDAYAALGTWPAERPRTTRLPDTEVPMGVVNASWEPHVRDRETGTVDRAAYACCVLDRLRVGLRRRDVYAPGSVRWGDPRAELLSPEAWEQRREQACEDLALDTDPARVVANLAQTLDSAWRRTADGMPNNPDLRIEHRDGADRIVVAPLDAIEEPASLVELRGMVEALLPEVEIADLPLEVHGWTDTAGASEIVVALAWATGYRYGPRLADLADHRLWVIDARADYGPLQGLARNRAKTSLITGQLDQICRLAASLEARTVTPSAILRSLQRGPNPSSLGRALVELGRIIKTLHVLDYGHDADYRRAIHRILVRGESRNSLARDTFHGGRGQLRQHYQAGQENQLGALGLMVNVIVLWQTVYIQAALDHLAATGHKIDPADVARLSPLGHPTINLNGRYRTTGRAPSSGMRPLRRAG